MNNKLKCLFGYHEFAIPNKKDKNVLMCKHCKKFGYRKYSSEFEIWFEYAANGNEIHYKTSLGFEEWYDYDENGNGNGNVIRYRNSYGYEEWLHKGKWVNIKPKDWEYEKEI